MKDYLAPKFQVIKVKFTDTITTSSQAPETNDDQGWSPIWRPGKQ